MLKIAFLVTEDWYFWSHRLALARYLKALGHHVIVITRVRMHGEKIKNEGFDLVPINLSRRSINPAREIRFLRHLYRIYKQYQPDIVHHIALKPVIYGSVAAKMTKIKAVVNTLTGLGYVFTSESKNRFLLRKLIVLLMRFSFSHPNCRIIFQNPDDMSLFIQLGIIQQEKSVLIPGSGVDTEKFVPGDKKNARPTAVFASRMLWDKGVRELVEAARILHEQNIAGDIVLAGIPDQENPTAVPVSWLKKWHERGVINWIGHQDDVVSLLQKSHIAVLPSYREGLPKSLLEAAACGLAIVTTDVPGCRTIVKNSVNGYLVHPKDADSLAEALKSLLNDPDLCKQMGEEGRKMVLDEFAENIIFERTRRVYENLAE